MSEVREKFVTIDVINRGLSVKKFKYPNEKYIATVIEGTTSDGQEFKKSLKEETLEKMPKLKAAIDALVEGETVKVVTEKKNGYNNIKSIHKQDDPLFSVTQSTNISGNAGGSTEGSYSGGKPQESIVFQNSMAHATALAIHNAGKDKVNVEDVLALARQIALVSISPSLFSDDTSEDIDVNDPAKVADMF